MPYVDLAGLSRYASRQKDRLERDCALLRDMQWLRTEKAGAVSLWPVGGTPLKPVVDFLFTEVPPASGDKGPDNPSTITGVSSVSVRQLGANLAYSAGRLYRFSSLGDGWYGTTVNNTSGTEALSARIRYLYGTDFSWIDTSKNYCCVVEYENCSNLDVGSTSSNSDTPLFAVPGVLSVSGTGVSKADLTLYSGGGTRNNILRAGALIPVGETRSYKFRIAVLQCTAAEVDLSTYQYDSANNLYTLPLGDTYYGGILDVASGVMTVTYGVKVLDGTGINWGTAEMQNHKSFYTVQDICVGRKSGNVIDASCSHFVQLFSLSADTIGFGFYSTSRGVYFFYGDINTTKEDFNTFLASEYANGTPVTIAYELATPLTVQLDPVSISALAQTDKYTPRLNTVYTDAQAVQVGYIKSSIREEYELQQAVIAQGGNV